jgi:hypothetical protein
MQCMLVNSIKLNQEQEEAQTTIRLKKSTRDKLDKLGNRHESYDLILRRLLDNYLKMLATIEEITCTFPIDISEDEKIIYEELPPSVRKLFDSGRRYIYEKIMQLEKIEATNTHRQLEKEIED